MKRIIDNIVIDGCLNIVNNIIAKYILIVDASTFFGDGIPTFFLIFFDDDGISPPHQLLQ